MTSKGSKKKVLPLAECKSMVLEYLKREYRPYAVTDLVLNLHNQISKPNMIKVLDELVAGEDIISKTYGKSTYYCYRKMDEQNAESSVTIEMHKELKRDLQIALINLMDKKKEITLYESRMTFAELQEMDGTLQGRIKHLTDEIDSLKKKSQGSFNGATVAAAEAAAEEEEEDDDDLLFSADVIKSLYEAKMKKFKVYSKVYKGMIATIKDSTDEYKKILEVIGVEEVPDIKEDN